MEKRDWGFLTVGLFVGVMMFAMINSVINFKTERGEWIAINGAGEMVILNLGPLDSYLNGIGGSYNMKYSDSDSGESIEENGHYRMYDGQITFFSKKDKKKFGGRIVFNKSIIFGDGGNIYFRQ